MTATPVDQTLNTAQVPVDQAFGTVKFGNNTFDQIGTDTFTQVGVLTFDTITAPIVDQTLS